MKWSYYDVRKSHLTTSPSSSDPLKRCMNPARRGRSVTLHRVYVRVVVHNFRVAYTWDMEVGVESNKRHISRVSSDWLVRAHFLFEPQSGAHVVPGEGAGIVSYN
jgi:hypothetical protein